MRRRRSLAPSRATPRAPASRWLRFCASADRSVARIVPPLFDVELVRLLTFSVLSLVVFPLCAYAQVESSPLPLHRAESTAGHSPSHSANRGLHLPTPDEWLAIVSGPLRTPLGPSALERTRTSDREDQSPTTGASQERRGVGRTVLGGVVGAVGGFFAGGFTGAAIEGQGCHCDDPGLKGFMIGAPIGALAGGIAGAKWLF